MIKGSEKVSYGKKKNLNIAVAFQNQYFVKENTKKTPPFAANSHNSFGGRLYQIAQVDPNLFSTVGTFIQILNWFFVLTLTETFKHMNMLCPNPFSCCSGWMFPIVILQSCLKSFADYNRFFLQDYPVFGSIYHLSLQFFYGICIGLHGCVSSLWLLPQFKNMTVRLIQRFSTLVLLRTISPTSLRSYPASTNLIKLGDCQASASLNVMLRRWTFLILVCWCR